MLVVSLCLLFLIRYRFPPDRSIAEVITTRYGRPVLATYRVLEKTEYKLKKGKADLQFLQTCQENNIIPKFLHFRLYKATLQTSELYRDTQKKLLSQEIKTKEKQISRLKNRVSSLHSQLRARTWYIDYNHFRSLIEKVTTRKIAGAKAIHMKKLHNLGYTPFKEIAADKVLFNFSSRVLSPAEESLLSKGLKFALPPRQLSLEKYLLTFERLYESLQKYPEYLGENSQFGSFKDKLRNLAFSTFERFKKHNPKPVLSKEEQKALKSLAKDKSLVITRPDKGNGVVLMDKQDYLNRVNNVLEDTSKFKKLEKSEENEPLKIVFRLEDKINRFLRKIFGLDSSGNRCATYKKLSVSGSSVGVLYGLPKVHKNTVNLLISEPYLSLNIFIFERLFFELCTCVRK